MVQYSDVHLGELYVTGISVDTSHHNRHSSHDIPTLWARFFTEDTYDSIQDRMDDRIIAIYHNYRINKNTKEIDSFTFTVGLLVKNLKKIPKGMDGVLIPKAHYAIVPVVGEFPGSLLSHWDSIHFCNLKRSYKVDFEIYPTNFDMVRNFELEIYCSVNIMPPQ
jgi:predicted transcriptional regulator YdeE